MTNLPVTGSFTVTAAYGETGSYWTSGHKGIDIVCTDRTVYATCDGTVFNMGYDANGWGNWVSVKDGDGNKHIFCHLENGSVRVSKGESVTRLTVIGKMGDTGNVTGVHLHYQINDRFGTPTDPTLHLGIPNKRGVYNSADYKTEDKMTYNDENKISDWAKVAVKTVTDAGIMQGDGKGNFNPKNNLTREQAAVIIARLLER